MTKTSSSLALSFLVLALASSSVACASAQSTQAAPSTPIEVNAADWTPPGEQQMTLPDAPAPVARQTTSTATMRPTVFSEGKKGQLVTLAVKRSE